MDKILVLVGSEALLLMSDKRILVVDDDPLVRESIELMLASEEYLLESVGSGFEAMTRYQVGRYALVLTDNRMGGMTGLELARNIKKQDPAQPVILFSGSPPAEPAVDCDLVILKPFSVEDLRRVVATWVKKGPAQA